MLRGAIFTVGGSPEPVVQALTWHPVEYVLFVVSELSEGQIKDSILPRLSFVPQYEPLRLSSAERLETVYAECRRGIREWLDRWRLSPDEVYFDCTGGTKPMSAGLTLAAVECIPRYHYVSGSRDKGQLGIVISGTERAVEGVTPLRMLALKQREAATRFYEQGYVEQAADLLEEAAQIATEQPATLKAFAALCRLLAKLDRLDFRGLVHDLGRCQPELEVAFEQAGNREALDWLRGLRTRFARLEEEVSRQDQHPECLRELLACARRRASQARYDDGIARLYRAVELFAQDRLHAAFRARLGKIKLTDLLEATAHALRTAFPRALDADDTLRLGLKDAFQALQFSAREEDRNLVHEYERLKPALEKRNQSWLAHGTRPASKADFEQMWQAVLEALGIQEHSVPAWPRISFTL